VIGIGLMAVVIDRLSGGGGPDPASAEPPNVDAASAMTEVAPAAIKILVQPAPFPDNFPTVDRPGPVRDLFAMTPAVRSLLAPDEDVASADKEPQGDDQKRPPTVEAFLADHDLSAVFVHGKARVAIVNGRMIQPGQTVEGCALREIIGQTVRFECRDGVAELRVEPQLGP
jgi:hypothetical protein